MSRHPAILHDVSACPSFGSKSSARPRAMRMLVSFHPVQNSNDQTSRTGLLPQSGFDWIYMALPFA